MGGGGSKFESSPGPQLQQLEGAPKGVSENNFFSMKKKLRKQYILIIIFINLEALKTALKGIKAPTPS